MQSLLRRLTKQSISNAADSGVAQAASETTLFTPTNPKDDGEECLHDCDTCTIRLPAKFKIDEEDKLYGHVKGWETHLLVATGKSDWVRDVEDEEHSVMEAVGQHRSKITNGKLMLSATNIPTPDYADSPDEAQHDKPTRCLLLPAFSWIENVRPSDVPDLLTSLVNRAPTNASPLPPPETTTTNGTTDTTTSPPLLHNTTAPPVITTDPLPDLPFRLVDCPHRYLILLCSQKTRDARCGQSAPLLRREFERQLRPLGLYRDLTDERPGGVGIYFISHVGGHKYSANVMIYRRGSSADTASGTYDGDADVDEQTPTKIALPDEHGFGEAAQCIWLARVRPEDCENIVRYTVLQGKVVKPATQLRGGFDRFKGLVSW